MYINIDIYCGHVNAQNLYIIKLQYGKDMSVRETPGDFWNSIIRYQKSMASCKGNSWK